MAQIEKNTLSSRVGHLLRLNLTQSQNEPLRGISMTNTTFYKGLPDCIRYNRSFSRLEKILYGEFAYRSLFIGGTSFTVLESDLAKRLRLSHGEIKKTLKDLNNRGLITYQTEIINDAQYRKIVIDLDLLEDIYFEHAQNMA